LSRIVKKRISVFYRPVTTYTSGTQRGGNRAISPYDNFRHGESFQKVGCSVGLPRVRAGAALDESGLNKVWESKRWGEGGT